MRQLRPHRRIHKSSSSRSSSQDKDGDVTATKSSKVANIITQCPNCSAEKTVLEHEQNDDDDDEEEEDDDDNDDEEGDAWSDSWSNIKIWTPEVSFN